MLTLSGIINIQMIKGAIPELARLLKEHNCFLILNDSREAVPDVSTIDIYSLPKFFSEMLSEAGVQVHKLRRAIIVSKDMNEFAFFETVSRNRAQNVMLFRDPDEAKKWLKE